MDSWFLAAVQGSSGNELFKAEDPLRRFCLGTLKNIPAQLICIILVLGQAFLINNHLVASSDPKNANLWIWFVGDGLIILLFIAAFYFKEWRLTSLTSKHKDSTGFMKGLPLGILGWFLYATLLGTRIAIIFKKDVQLESEISDLRLTISGTALICVMFTIGHHHNKESLARRASILSLARNFTIDLLDTVEILNVLFEIAKEHKTDFPLVLEDIVLAIVTLNLLRPSVSLISLFMDHFSTRRRALEIKIAKTIMELLLLNIPLLTIRIYLSVHYGEFLSVFLVKNIMGSIVGMVEIYDCVYDIYEYKNEKVTESESSEPGKEGTDF
ncbi:hypothetical protein EB796_010494 [Bugula neritina]|uniref:Uncharacterized protein n=1 Tax=Bugula neritina TaxID=10212 RepID=A0A7J7K109_BUGNE|nr:hypothetical protein EB796_010494 [Bugula neritina]